MPFGNSSPTDHLAKMYLSSSDRMKGESAVYPFNDDKLRNTAAIMEQSQ